MQKVLVILFMLCVTIKSQVQQLEVSLDDGTRIIGSIKTTSKGEQVKEFLGIPYAEPPIGELRFRAPVPKGPSSAPINATIEPLSCLQFWRSLQLNEVENLWISEKEKMSENCLYLNVWVPENLEHNSSLPVMIWIHGGGFITGSSIAIKDEAQIMATEQNVIVVSMNYRLSAFGFLTTTCAGAAGNTGLMDQLMALEWVHENIASFGGDPGRVTLIGHDAGAASVGYHLLSDLSRPYFQRIIMHNGSPTAIWAYNNRNKMLKRSFSLASALNCTHGISEDTIKSLDCNEWDQIIKCLANVPAETLLENIFLSVNPSHLVWTPTDDDYFLNRSPKIMIKIFNQDNDKNIMIGTNFNEPHTLLPLKLQGIYESELFYEPHDEESSNKLMDRYFKKFLPADFHHKIIKQAILFEYKNWSLPETPLHRYQILENIFKDYQFLCPSKQMADAFRAESKVYMYHFSKDGRQPSTQQMMSYWANFALSGDPNNNTVFKNDTINWPEYQENQEMYMTNEEEPVSDANVKRRRMCAFWQQYLSSLMKSL